MNNTLSNLRTQQEAPAIWQGHSDTATSFFLPIWSFSLFWLTECAARPRVDMFAQLHVPCASAAEIFPALTTPTKRAEGAAA